MELLLGGIRSRSRRSPRTRCRRGTGTRRSTKRELTTASCEVCDFSEEAVEVRGVVIDCDGMVVLVGDDGQLAGAACV